MSSLTPIAIIGAGPAGLIAAETLAQAGQSVVVYDRMRSPARKLLMAGRGGLNLTHSEDVLDLINRYGAAAKWMAPLIEAFPPSALRQWCEGLGQATFVGTSGRVFPQGLKTSPLLRAWLWRLDGLGVRQQMRWRWTGWDGAGRLLFVNPEGGCHSILPPATVLALGGASWPRLGSDGGWVEPLTRQGVAVTPLQPANCGFEVPWSDFFRQKFAGTPLKPVAVSFGGVRIQGELMITARGLEGGPIYAQSGPLRNAIAAAGHATVTLDLRPGLSQPELARRLSAARGAVAFELSAQGWGALAIGGGAAARGRGKQPKCRAYQSSAPVPDSRSADRTGDIHGRRRRPGRTRRAIDALVPSRRFCRG